ncbi:MAG: sigma factor-like helix-turn-helix DNA-binding protein, partial [Planctomycetota bacterium]
RHEQETDAMADTGTRAFVPDHETASEAEAVRAAIDGLQEPWRTAVKLRYWEGLSLAAIGSAIGCAESTVHGRLGEALERLRRRLLAGGLAAAAARLEPALAASAPAVATAPAGLVATLLAIPMASAGFSALKLAAAAALALGGGAVLWAASVGEEPASAEAGTVAAAAIPIGLDGDEFAPSGGIAASPFDATGATREAERRPDAAARAAGAPPRDQEPAADLPTSFLAGTVVADDGAPLAEVTVWAHCREQSRKAAPFRVPAVTDARGAFELALPNRHPDGHAWDLSLAFADWVGAFAPARWTLRPGDRVHGAAGTMRRLASDRPGDWRGRAVVVDAAGRPIADVGVMVLRVVREASGGERLVREGGARSDARGVVELAGDHFGEKVVRAAPFGKPFVGCERRLAVDGPALGPVELVLPPDVPLSVRVVEARTGAPLARMHVTAERSGQGLAVAFTDRDGRAVLRGLDGAPVTLVGGADAFWSAMRRDDAVPGAGEVELRRKRMADPESIGLHGTELHGRVVDAATGAGIAVEYGAISTRWIADGETLDRVLAEAITPWPFQTCAMGEVPPPAADFHLSFGEGGRVVLLLKLPGRALAAAGPFDLVAGAVTRGAELRVDTGRRVAVSVRDAAGAPVPGAEVWFSAPGPGGDADRGERAAQLRRDEQSESRSRPGRGLRAGAAGRAEFEHVPNGLPLRVHAAVAGAHGACDLVPGAGAAVLEVVVR